MPPGGFTNTPTGGLIQTAAQQIIANRRQQRALELREEQAEANRKLAERNLELRERNADIQEQFAKTQAEFAKFKQAGQERAARESEASIALDQARTLKTLREAQTTGRTRGRPPSLSELSNIHNKLKISAKEAAFQKFVTQEGFQLSATETFARLSKELTVTNVEQTLSALNTQKILTEDPEKVKEIDSRIQRITRLQEIMLDPEFTQAIQSIELGIIPEDIKEQATSGVFPEASFATPEQRDRAIGDVMAAGPQPVTFMPNIGSDFFKQAADGALEGQPAIMLSLMTSAQVTGPLEGDILREFASRLSAEGYDEEQARKILLSIRNAMAQ